MSSAGSGSTSPALMGLNHSSFELFLGAGLGLDVSRGFGFRVGLVAVRSKPPALMGLNHWDRSNGSWMLWNFRCQLRVRVRYNLLKL
jgi:hypothetical protein